MKLRRRRPNLPGMGSRPNFKLLFGLIAALVIMVFLIPVRSGSPTPKDSSFDIPPLWYDLGLSWEYIVLGIILIGVILAALLVALNRRNHDD